ncbi:DUF5652 family protein [Leifsonia sp. 22587]|uniref:DUF5652 family protein n=1 Tax=Leifsonia sp. 22587 TaxID=3453946 RepID=UPI003F87A304
MKANQSSMSWMRDHDVSAKSGTMVAAVVAWSLAWKGVSLWRAARNDSKPWFVALLLSNTLGVLDAIYLFLVDRPRRARARDEEWILATTGEPEQRTHPPED